MTPTTLERIAKRLHALAGELERAATAERARAKAKPLQSPRRSLGTYATRGHPIVQFEAIEVPKALTPRQREVHNAIVDFVEREGFVPTIRNLMTVCGGHSTHGMHEMLGKLESKGYIRRQPWGKRSVIVAIGIDAP